tara:strand:+ start:326 stop:586 length:261 start_codon:yes stop_codon:yes gene_type:complete
MLSIINKLDKINKLKKNDINTKNDNLTMSLLILDCENKIFEFVTIFGLTSFNVSVNVPFSKIYILKNFIPEVLEIIEPPIIDKTRK